MIAPATKLCSSCGRELPLSKFERCSRSRSHRPRCRACRKADRERRQLAPRERMVDDLENPQDDDPTPDQIRERCLEVQQHWTPRERLMRRLIGTTSRHVVGRLEFEHVELTINQHGEAQLPVYCAAPRFSQQARGGL